MLALIQVGLGRTAHNNFTTDRTSRPWFNAVHVVLGTLTLLLAWLQMALGFNDYSDRPIPTALYIIITVCVSPLLPLLPPTTPPTDPSFPPHQPRPLLPPPVPHIAPLPRQEATRRRSRVERRGVGTRARLGERQQGLGPSRRAQRVEHRRGVYGRGRGGDPRGESGELERVESLDPTVGGRVCWVAGGRRRREGKESERGDGAGPTIINIFVFPSGFHAGVFRTLFFFLIDVTAHAHLATLHDTLPLPS